VKVAEQYARAGTSGFGGSQKIAATLEALIIATLELPEQIGNGATARQVRTGVQKRLKINKSF
jgi:hypothetical protein